MGYLYFKCVCVCVGGCHRFRAFCGLNTRMKMVIGKLEESRGRSVCVCVCALAMV